MSAKGIIGSVCVIAMLSACSSGDDDVNKQAANQPKTKYCHPDQPCWPNNIEWQNLNEALHGRLLKLQAYMGACKYKPDSQACKLLIEKSQNPFYVEDQPQDTQISGWLNAWESTASPYAVAAQSVEDIQAGIAFAKKHHLRVVIKGAGHDYLGRNNAKDSLLIWTHNMRETKMIDAFVPLGCPSSYEGVPAFSAGAGTRWLEAYDLVTTQNGRYVQGGNCTSVGVAGGFMQGGGFGSYSRTYGMGSDGLLEVEIVTADGEKLVANECQHQDLFWALHGGGGGTFGVVTKVVLKTHELPNTLGMLKGNIHADNDKAYYELLKQFVNFYRDNLNNSHWGKIISFTPANDIELTLLFQNLSQEEAEAAFEPLRQWVADRSSVYSIELDFSVLPKASDNWDPHYYELNDPKQVVMDKRVGQPERQYWWANHQLQLGLYFYSYASRWIPEKMLAKESADVLAKAFYDASRYLKLELHPNKGLAGASAKARQGKDKSAINPKVYDAAMLVILGAGQLQTYPGVKGYEVKKEQGEKEAKGLNAALTILRAVTPGAGAYSNEADYFEPNWQESFWGSNYPRLLAIKKKYDPNNFFTCHHCVGSEEE